MWLKFNLNALGVTLVVLLLANVSSLVDAECCEQHKHPYCHPPGTPPHKMFATCGDCTLGTPYCGVGECNIFGCNCDGGCRKTDNPPFPPALHMSSKNVTLQAKE